MSETKLSGGTRCLIDDYQERGQEAVSLRSRVFGVYAAEGGNDPEVHVFLTVDPAVPLSGLDPSIRVTQRPGNLQIATIPLSLVKDLAAHPAVQRVQIARYLRPTLNDLLPFLHVPPLEPSTGASKRQVLVGIVDSGIDGSHSAFANGRILTVWDQTANGAGVAEGPGLELRDGETRKATDERGHGTHVAGIAVGNHPIFAGMAPNAKLAIVKTDFQDANVVRGLWYLERIAREKRLPLVVNLSLGGHLDGHDGDDELSLAVDQFSGPERIVCCAAGNEGQDAIHASITMAQGDTAEITFEISAARELVVLNGWYSGQDEIDVAVEDPNGLRTAFQQPIVGSQQLQRYAVGAAIVQAVTPSAAGSHSDRHFHIQLSRRGGLPQGTWKLLLSARVARVGIIDVWSTDDHGDAGAPFTSHVDDRMKVGSPGCARSAITVGNYASRLRYTADTGFSVKGRSFVFPNQVVPGSSRGPTRDNRPKPEILAPGAVVISALSSQSQISPDLQVSGTFRAMEGTSMSCAVVSGLAARLLETEPNLTPDDFKRRLIRSVQSGVGAPPKSNPQEDAGLIDAGRL